MRITTNSLPSALIDQLGSLAARQQRLQTQASTGQRIRSPEDDPAAMRRVIDLQSEARGVEQYQRNIDRQSELANATFASLKALKKTSDRASEIATLADGLKSRDQLRVFATEVNELIKQAVQTANAKNRGDSLFAGTLNNQAAFAMTTDPDGRVTAVTYQGNAGQAEMEIAENATVSTQVPGANTSGVGPRGLITDSRTGADFFNHLISLQNHLLSGDTASIKSTDIPQLGADEDNFVLHYGQNGALQARLETATAIARDRSLSLEQRVSHETDADLAETMVRLSQTQNAYRAALQSAGAILGQSLLDYLR